MRFCVIKLSFCVLLSFFLFSLIIILYFNKLPRAFDPSSSSLIDIHIISLMNKFGSGSRLVLGVPCGCDGGQSVECLSRLPQNLN